MAPASLPCTPLFVAMRHLPPTGGSLCSLAAVSSAAIPVRVKLKTPLRNAAAATTLDIPTGWDPNTKKEPTGLFFAACGRPCSFDSSYGLHETATTLDVPSCWDPRTKQQPTGLIAYPAAQGRAVRFPCGLHETATTLDIPSRWDPRANQSPTGALVAVLRTAALFDSRAGQIKNALAQCAKAFL